MPLYDMHSPPSASPMHFTPQATHPSIWASQVAPTSYYSPTYGPPAPYSVENGYAMTAQPHPMPPSSSVVGAPPFGAHSLAPYHQGPPAGPDLSKTTVVGYELLADKLAELPKHDAGASTKDGTIVPMYRKFEQLNHRVLLHLQDEISELEEELRSTDECIAQSSPRTESGQLHPASRRGDARYGGELHYKRTELLGRIYQKLGQYSIAPDSWHAS
jgi:hypothetical protein